MILLYNTLSCIACQSQPNNDHIITRLPDMLAKDVTSLFRNTMEGTSITRYFVKGNEKEVLVKSTNIANKTDHIFLPEYTRGIYLTNNVGNSISRMQYFIQKSKQYHLNTFVIDIQKNMIPKEIIDMVKRASVFLVARLVVFENGLKQRRPTEAYLQHILALIQDASAQGFQEVQLDYIRYADIPNLLGLSLQYKYAIINHVLLQASQTAYQNQIYLSADLFGRTTLSHDDPIGQKIENFAKHVQTLYPMLYPSHYTNDITRISQPYETIKEGVMNARKRVLGTRIVPYIQGFNMHIKASKLNMVEYIKRQLQACEDAQSDGWIVWNAQNRYEPLFQAIEKYNYDKPSVNQSQNSSLHSYKNNL